MVVPAVILTVWAFLAQPVYGVNFPYEDLQLTDADVGNFEAIAFGDASNPAGPLVTRHAECRPLPGQTGWPAPDEWAQLNLSLGGALLRPTPAGAVCYPKEPEYNAERCDWLLTNASSARFYLNDPLTVLTAWTMGDTCPPFLPGTAPPASGECEMGGFPEYVINATTVKHIQIGVNFARNKGLRLVVKNTGHDFNGRSAGKGALSIWTHHLKDFDNLDRYKVLDYEGTAARVGSGLEAFELYAAMDKYSITIVAPGGQTVGAYGGWIGGGGHSVLTSAFGAGSDQVLSMQVVTADGRLVEAKPLNNTDLYYAIRGGGPGTYGIVTSAVIKTCPSVHITRTTLAFNFLNSTTYPGGGDTKNGSVAFVDDPEVFWRGINDFHYFGKYVADRGGITFNYVTPTGTGTDQNYTFTSAFQLPGYTPEDMTAFLQPFYDRLRDNGIPVRLKTPRVDRRWGGGGTGDSPGDTRFSSRLWPLRTWHDRPLFDRGMEAVRALVEAGYVFHTVHMQPSEEVAHLPGGIDNGVNPAYRTCFMHATMFDRMPWPPGSRTPENFKARHARLNHYVDGIREATRVGGGAYINEADVQEPNWQESFFGHKYDKLVSIKRARDPWGLFWIPTTPGSEGWAVRDPDGLPTQNGPLCRTSCTA